ncbi:MAG: heme exporter protein CcmB [Steroidobacteraceae bacterium]
MSEAVGAALALLKRDLRLALRRPGQLLQPLGFFIIVAVLFPLGFTPQLSRLRDIAPGVLWIAALLSSMLANELLFREDSDDGTLEQIVLAGQPLPLLVLVKTAAHWLLTGLPLAIMAPFLGVALGVPLHQSAAIVLALVMGTMSLSLTGSIGASLVLGVRRGGVLMSILTLPLAVPVLIFGARASELAIQGADTAAPLYLLAAIAVLGVTLAPLAAAAALRIGLE